MPEKGVPDLSTLSKKHLKPSIPLFPLVQVPAGSSDKLYTCRVSELPIPWTFSMPFCEGRDTLTVPELKASTELVGLLPSPNSGTLQEIKAYLARGKALLKFS